MISLSEFLITNIKSHIFEATLQNKEWHYLHKGDDHFYPRNVIRTLITTGEILLGKNAENATKSSKLSDKAIEQLKELDITKDNALTLFDDIVKEFGFTWRNIFKGAYSGTTNGGSGEILVCYLYNHPKATDEELFEIARLEHIDNDLINSWVTSAKNTVKLLNNKWSNSKYYAIQIDKNDIKYYTANMDKTMLSSICDLYSNKEFIGKCGVQNANKLYSRSKDEWQKSDILLVKHGKNYYDEIITAINDSLANNVETYNSLLKTLAINDEILPLSLKKTPDGSADIYSYNLNEDKIIQLLDDIKVDLKLPQSKKLPEGLGGSTYLICNNDSKQTKLQFKKRPTGNTFVVEIMLKNSMGGRGLQQILNHLSISNRDFNKTELSKDEVVDGLKEYFSITENDIKDIIEASDIWYKKLCFNKLIVLLNKYYDKFGNGCKKSEIVTPFFIFSYECCEGKSTGSYYIIK